MKRCARVRVLLGVSALLLALVLAGCSAGTASETPAEPSPSASAPGASLPVGGGQDSGAAASQSAPVGTTVYVAAGGTKYHVLGCQYLNKSRTAISLSEAKSQGLTPCKVCKPPQ
jgi:hypothetical protein